ncbi:MAG TPA: lysophospholipid acyltransferase family protein [Myxococcales bacterium]
MIVLLALRTFLGAIVIVIATIVGSILIGIAGDREFSEKVLRAWARLFLAVAGVRVISRELAPLDRSRSYVFVSNHTSNIDVPAILAVTPEPLRFIAKQELTRIPLFGWAARRMGHVFIDRKDSHGAAKAIRRRIDAGLSGVGLFFFAEGTRSTSEEMLPFKKGAAVAALETGLDCVPIAVAGARDVLRPKGVSVFRPGPVAVVFGAPISLSGYSLDRRDALVEAQRAAVENALAEARALVARARGS